MSNWQYGKVVPTKNWRSANTVPRDLGIKKIGDKYLVTSLPVKELDVLNDKQTVLENIPISNYDLTKKVGKLAGPVKINLTSDQIETFSITLSNERGEKMVVGYNKATNYYYADRSASGITGFEKEFVSFHFAPRLTEATNLNLSLIIDAASIEFFADDGLTVMTNIFFPTTPYNQVTIQSTEGTIIKKLEYVTLKSIWR
jgi:fructan beta-fructosidase